VRCCRQGLGGIQFRGLGGGWQVALRFESVSHGLNAVARGPGRPRHASLGPTRVLANLGDRCAKRPRTSHSRYDQRQQRLDDRKFLTIESLNSPILFHPAERWSTSSSPTVRLLSWNVFSNRGSCCADAKLDARSNFVVRPSAIFPRIVSSFIVMFINHLRVRGRVSPSLKNS
jgi:hypothetical protein